MIPVRRTSSTSPPARRVLDRPASKPPRAAILARTGIARACVPFEGKEEVAHVR